MRHIMFTALLLLASFSPGGCGQNNADEQSSATVEEKKAQQTQALKRSVLESVVQTAFGAAVTR